MSSFPSSSSSDTTRHMNDTTMPPPPKQPRQTTTNTTKTTTTATTTATAAKAIPRNKTALRKGFGLSDWNKLVRCSTDLAQLRGAGIRHAIAWHEIKQHNTMHDGWVVLRRKVYNLSPYLPYHPGGQAILQNVLGKDITALYDKYHRWVNEEGYVCVRQAVCVCVCVACPDSHSHILLDLT